MIEVEALSFDYPGKRVLQDISFRLEAGSITALVGPNGAGKTTLMRCLAALQIPTEGVIRVAGIDVFDDPRAIHRKVGYLSDFFGLYEDLTVYRCLLHRAAIQKSNHEDEKALALAAAEKVQLQDRLQQKAGTLSRGLKQRLGIGMAIVHDPAIIILDEPASGLDPEARIELSHLLRSLRDHGATLLVSSHILAELQDYSTHMMILEAGRLVDITALDELAPPDLIVMRLKIAGEDGALLEKLQGIAGITVRDIAAGEAIVLLADNDRARAEALSAMVARGIAVSEFVPAKASLQDQYLARLKARGKE